MTRIATGKMPTRFVALIYSLGFKNAKDSANINQS